MAPPWKLVVDGLGRIGHAEIEARPLLLFVGGNNTGKTYLASLMWGLLSLSGELPVAHGEAFQRCVAWIEGRFARREQEPSFEITPEVHADLVQIINDTLRDRGATLAERAFNRTGFQIGKIELRDVVAPGGGALRIGTLAGLPSIWTPTQFGGAPADIIDHLAKLRVLGGLGGDRATFSRRQVSSGPVFLPASRTGFMLTYRALAQQLVGDALIKSAPAGGRIPDLTAPTIDFLTRLIGLRPEAGAYPEEAAFLEGAIGGRFSLRSDVGLNEVLYEHAEGEPALPMQLSSSLVTELAPIILTLRHLAGYRVLIIEEPEAHLHPALQRRLAQGIVRLVRQGLHVWITTHSENLCQQINNFMKLGAHPRRGEMRLKYGYGESDYLTPEDLGGYQFEADPASGHTIVTEMKKTAQGLVMPTFNRELGALTDEAMDLEQPEGA